MAMNRSTTTKQALKRPPKLAPAPAPPKSRTSDLPPDDPEELQERLLEQIAEGGKLCQEIESRLRQHHSPELETIIKLHRVLVLSLSAEAQAMPERFHLVSSLMRPVMEWARLEEKRKVRELAEQKYRDEAAAQKAKEERGPGSSLTPETLEKIEHALNLF
jgi:hypothetical protein